jgi:hypothetical protein
MVPPRMPHVPTKKTVVVEERLNRVGGITAFTSEVAVVTTAPYA